MAGGKTSGPEMLAVLVNVRDAATRRYLFTWHLALPAVPRAGDTVSIVGFAGPEHDHDLVVERVEWRVTYPEGGDLFPDRPDRKPDIGIVLECLPRTWPDAPADIPEPAGISEAAEDAAAGPADPPDPPGWPVRLRRRLRSLLRGARA